jgi:hypothetical protein
MLFRKLRKAREGSSMVTVIIGVMFLAAVGLIALTVATHYVTAVYEDRNSTDNFYQAEGILEEVKTGIVQYASESADEAYRYIMNHYLEQSTENKKSQFAKMYLELLSRKLRGTKTQESEFATIFTDDFFKNFDTKYLNKEMSCGSASANVNSIRKLSAANSNAVTMSAIYGTSTEEYFYEIQKDSKKGYSLTLKNLRVEYTDESGYESSIDTGIVITVPDYKFQGDSTLNEISSYVSISDDTLTAGAYVKTDVTGNVYAGKALSASDTANQGIKLDKYANVKFNSQKIISRGNLDVLPGTTVDISGESGAAELWLNNIRMTYDGNSSSALLDDTNFTMNANAYIANDLDIATNNCNVKLKGKYYGYSYNKENDANDSAQISAYSSAILINGKNTTLDADALEKLILAGRTFVSRNDDDGNLMSESDIMMGESIAVKSNQVAYLVPDEYITFSDGSDEGHNPVNETQIVNEEKMAEDLLAADVFKDSKNKSLLNETSPFTANYYSSADGEPKYRYYFLNFKNAKAANTYFANYYAGTSIDEDGYTYTNQSVLSERAKVYISGTDMSGLKLSPTLFLAAGNIIQNYNDTSGSIAKNGDEYFDGSGNPKEDLLRDGRTMGCEYVGLQKSLIASGSTGSMRLDDSEEPLVSGTIIDSSKIASSDTKSVPAEYTPDTTGAKIQIIKAGSGETEVSIDKGLVIAGEDVNVKVEKNFTGLILSAGKVTIPQNMNLNMKADSVLIKQIMEYIKSDSYLSSLFPALSGTLTNNPTDTTECVSYSNWVKNS